jgi:hypothetical protein
MANLKQDLLNELNNQKYYNEQELTRLYDDNSSSYKNKVNNILDVLQNIVLIDAKAQMVEFYFKEQVSQQVMPNNGQSHQE